MHVKRIKYKCRLPKWMRSAPNADEWKRIYGNPATTWVAISHEILPDDDAREELLVLKEMTAPMIARYVKRILAPMHERKCTHCASRNQPCRAKPNAHRTSHKMIQFERRAQEIYTERNPLRYSYTQREQQLAHLECMIEAAREFGLFWRV